MDRVRNRESAEHAAAFVLITLLTTKHLMAPGEVPAILAEKSLDELYDARALAQSIAISGYAAMQEQGGADLGDMLALISIFKTMKALTTAIDLQEGAAPGRTSIIAEELKMLLGGSGIGGLEDERGDGTSTFTF
jgi:hypothetical protein